MSDFLGYAEDLWTRWLNGPVEVSPELASLFELDACPEPYLDFDAGAHPLVIMTTNPGAPMPHQMRAAIHEGQSPVDPSMSYAEVARAMADFYRAHLRGAAARRISAQLEVANAAGFDGVVQVECCPWHSADLPNKSRFLKLLLSDPELAAYESKVRDFIAECPAVAVSAVSSRATLQTGALELSPWLAWQADVLGLGPKPRIVVPLVRNENRVTGAAVVSAESGGATRALVLMMGSNNFPGQEGRDSLARALRRHV